MFRGNRFGAKYLIHHFQNSFLLNLGCFETFPERLESFHNATIPLGGVGGAFALASSGLIIASKKLDSKVKNHQEVATLAIAKGLVNKYRGAGSERMGSGLLDFEPSQGGGSLNFEQAKGGGSSYL